MPTTCQTVDSHLVAGDGESVLEQEEIFITDSALECSAATSATAPYNDPHLLIAPQLWNKTIV